LLPAPLLTLTKLEIPSHSVGLGYAFSLLEVPLYAQFKFLNYTIFSSHLTAFSCTKFIALQAHSGVEGSEESVAATLSVLLRGEVPPLLSPPSVLQPAPTRIPPLLFNLTLIIAY
jgi:hypothetical protein